VFDLDQLRSSATWLRSGTSAESGTEEEGEEISGSKRRSSSEAHFLLFVQRPWPSSNSPSWLHQSPSYSEAASSRPQQSFSRGSCRSLEEAQRRRRLPRRLEEFAEAESLESRCRFPRNRPRRWGRRQIGDRRWIQGDRCATEGGTYRCKEREGEGQLKLISFLPSMPLLRRFCRPSRSSTRDTSIIELDEIFANDVGLTD